MELICCNLVVLLKKRVNILPLFYGRDSYINLTLLQNSLEELFYISKHTVLNTGHHSEIVKPDLLEFKNCWTIVYIKIHEEV